MTLSLYHKISLFSYAKDAEIKTDLTSISEGMTSADAQNINVGVSRKKLI